MPIWLLLEAKRRKKSTGHAMPFRALEDAAQARVSETVRLAEQEQRLREEKASVTELEDIENAGAEIQNVK